MEATKTCGECKYFVRIEESSGRGECGVPLPMWVEECADDCCAWAGDPAAECKRFVRRRVEVKS